MKLSVPSRDPFLYQGERLREFSFYSELSRLRDFEILKNYNLSRIHRLSRKFAQLHNFFF